jgi:histidinol-phosphate phosphatase family protein
MELDWKVDSSWTLFLDRDGVINERLFGEYILQESDFHFKEGVLEVSSSLFSKFMRVILVTNQQCIGKGLITNHEVDRIHQFMLSEFNTYNAEIDLVLIAPEVKGEQSTMRKPSPRMAHLAKQKFSQIDFSKSVMVGDTDTDIEFGKNLGMKTVLITSEELCVSVPDLKVSSLVELNLLLE